MQKRSPHLTVLSVVFVGAMVFLLPNLLEDANAMIRAFATPHGGSFSDVKGTMTEGTFVTEPRETRPIQQYTSGLLARRHYLVLRKVLLKPILTI